MRNEQDGKPAYVNSGETEVNEVICRKAKAGISAYSKSIFYLQKINFFDRATRAGMRNAKRRFFVRCMLRNRWVFWQNRALCGPAGKTRAQHQIYSADYLKDLDRTIRGVMISYFLVILFSVVALGEGDVGRYGFSQAELKATELGEIYKATYVKIPFASVEVAPERFVTFALILLFGTVFFLHILWGERSKYRPSRHDQMPYIFNLKGVIPGAINFGILYLSPIYLLSLFAVRSQDSQLVFDIDGTIVVLVTILTFLIVRRVKFRFRPLLVPTVIILFFAYVQDTGSRVGEGAERNSQFRFSVFTESLMGTSFNRIDISAIEYLFQRNFAGSQITNSNMSVDLIEDSLFTQSTISQTDFRSTSFRNANFSFSQISDVNFRGSTLRGCIFDWSTIISGNTQAARFVGCSMRRIDLHAANLDHAFMVESDLTGAVFGTGINKFFERDRVSLERNPAAPKLYGVKHAATELLLNQFGVAAIHRELRIEDSSLNYSNFRFVDLQTASFRNSTIQQGDFTGARLNHVCFSNADLEGASFDNAEIIIPDLSNWCFIDEPPASFSADLPAFQSVATLRNVHSDSEDFSEKVLPLRRRFESFCHAVLKVDDLGSAKGISASWCREMFRTGTVDEEFWSNDVSPTLREIDFTSPFEISKEYPKIIAEYKPWRKPDSTEKSKYTVYGVQIGSNITSAGAGVVLNVTSGESISQPTVIAIEHRFGFRTKYLFHGTAHVGSGQEVLAGTTIGEFAEVESDKKLLGCLAFEVKWAKSYNGASIVLNPHRFVFPGPYAYGALGRSNYDGYKLNCSTK